MWRGVGVVALSLLAAYWFCGTNSTQLSGQGDPATERALVAITTGHFDPARPQALFPATWVAVMGYRPAVTIGPHGTPILSKTTRAGPRQSHRLNSWRQGYRPPFFPDRPTQVFQSIA